ncbi:MAG: c-type cytochrome [Proteobacteria bacterium]|nr:c-type cytochrome [Pseudomonadota bacterium]
MYPFASASALTDSPDEGPQALADVAAYIETLEMAKDIVKGPGGTLFILKNEYEIAPHKALELMEKKMPRTLFTKLNKLKNKAFKSKRSFLKAVDKAIGKSNTRKYMKDIMRTADWSSDLKLGKKLFTDNCIRCHGDHGQGMYKDYYPVIAGQNYFYLMRQFAWIKGGKRRNANPDMVKQIAGFSDLDLRSVLDVASRFVMKKGDWDKN